MVGGMRSYSWTVLLISVEETREVLGRLEGGVRLIKATSTCEGLQDARFLPSYTRPQSSHPPVLHRGSKTKYSRRQ